MLVNGIGEHTRNNCSSFSHSLTEWDTSQLSIQYRFHFNSNLKCSMLCGSKCFDKEIVMNSIELLQWNWNQLDAGTEGTKMH